MIALRNDLVTMSRSTTSLICFTRNLLAFQYRKVHSQRYQRDSYSYFHMLILSTNTEPDLTHFSLTNKEHNRIRITILSPPLATTINSKKSSFQKSFPLLTGFNYKMLLVLNKTSN